jgi:hypothetical protein
MHDDATECSTSLGSGAMHDSRTGDGGLVLLLADVVPACDSL